jgi:hypothetical protein
MSGRRGERPSLSDSVPAALLPADNPAYRRIVAQVLGVVHVLISSKAAEHRLPQQADQRMAAVPAGSRISECLARHLGQAECVVEFAVCQQSRVGRDHEPTKLEHQAVAPMGTFFPLSGRAQPVPGARKPPPARGPSAGAASIWASCGACIGAGRRTRRAEHGAFAPPFTAAGLFFMRNRSLFIRGVLLGLYLLLLHD